MLLYHVLGPPQGTPEEGAQTCSDPLWPLTSDPCPSPNPTFLAGNCFSNLPTENAKERPCLPHCSPQAPADRLAGRHKAIPLEVVGQGRGQGAVDRF